MAKAVQESDPVRIADPQKWLAEVLRSRFADVVAHRAAALDLNQIEGIHDMRVAIRRLRSVIRDFAEIAEQFALKDIRKELSRIADALGAVRDADVAIISLEKLRAKAKDEAVAGGIDLFIQRSRGQRANAFEKLEQRLSQDGIDQFTARFERSLDGTLGQRGLFEVSTIEDAREQIIANRIDDFIRLSDALYDSHRFRRLHRLRIAAKHLRYAVELFSPAAKANGPAAEVAEMQSYLGDVHDCDAWLDKLRATLKAKKRKTLSADERRAALWLLAKFSRRRNRAYRSALELWTAWENNGFLESLANGRPH